ncbi:hypothetical protein C5745_19800 [Sphingobacterium haloxyli]|uniref:Uncharacterized protein n=1 Tax=Sphingobacterium haloxyli TaxID=2100533 RepID=A0A2S9ITB3_9SPHI|nr:hypothetical protein C5745_19800 [Sphingobacterium haloxyli]
MEWKHMGKTMRISFLISLSGPRLTDGAPKNELKKICKTPISKYFQNLGTITEIVYISTIWGINDFGKDRFGTNWKRR